MTDRVSRLYLLGGAIALGCFAVVPPLEGSTWLYELVALSPAAAIVVALVWFRPVPRLPWVLFVVAQLALFSGDLFYFTRDLSFPSYADGVYVLYYPFQAIGLILLVRHRTSEKDVGSVLDGLMFTLAFSMLVWVYVIDPSLSPSTEGTISTWFTVGYPALDLLLVSIALRLALGGVRSPAFTLMTAGLVCLTLVDAGYATTELSGNGSFEVFLDCGWMASYLLWGAAALDPSMRTMARGTPVPVGSLSVSRTLVMAASVLIGPVVLLIESQRSVGGFDVRFVIVASALIFLFALARMLGLVLRLREAVERHERSELRESILRNASTALTAAPDREYVRLAALEGGIALTRDVLGARVSVDLCDGRDLPSPDRSAPSGTHIVSLATKSAPYGRLVVTCAAPIPTHVADGLDALGAQVALALEAVALTDGLSRQHSEARVGALVQNSSDMIMVVSADLTIRYVTPSVAQSLGHDPDELIGTSATSLADPADQDLVRDFYADMVRHPGKSLTAEWRMRRADGRFTDFEAVVHNQLDNPSIEGIVVTAHDITDRKALEAGLKKQVQELEELDRVRSEFVATVSHELRTPLTSIIGEVEMLVDGDRDALTQNQAKGVDAIGRNSSRLLMLIEDLLTLSTIETTNELRMNRAPVEVGCLIDGLRSVIEPAAASKAVGFTASWGQDTGTVEVDRDQLERALLNLLTNAVKFTPEGGQISLAAQRSGSDLVVTVADTGLGIPEDEQDQLFTRFFRSTVANKMAIQGTGLGLVIVKQIVEEHGGSVSIDSDVGIGTTVTVRIPAEDVAEPQPGAA